MKLTGSRKIIGLVALAAMLLTGIAAFAQQGTTQGQGGQQEGQRHWGDKGGRGRHDGGGRGDFDGRGFGLFSEKLNLTDAQKEQLKQIATRYHESFKANRGQRGEERGGFDPLGGGAFNEAAVRAAAQARANARVEMEVARARMMYEMYNVLTAEQKAQLAAERQQREQKRQEWRSRRQSNTGAIQ